MKKDLLVKKIESASKEELFMMLVDGAKTFSTQARQHMVDEKYYEANELFIKTQRIILELVKSLNKTLIGDDIYNNLVGLYMFCFRRFYEGNIRRDLKLIDEGLQILTNLRNMWKDAIDKNIKEQNKIQSDPSFKPGSMDFQT